MPKPHPSVDPKVHDLAQCFLSECPGATEDDTWNLAALIQTACEDVCREVEGRATPAAKVSA